MSYNLFTPDHKKIDWVRIETGNTVLHQLNHQDASYSHETQDFGHVDIIFETDAFGVYRLNVAPGHSIPLHFHRTMREAELNLTDRMECQGRSLSYGMAFAWPHLLPHIYCNPLNETAKILCVDQPKFIPDDEVVCTSDKPLTWLADRRILNLYQIITGASGS